MEEENDNVVLRESKWKTREIAKDLDRETYLKISLRDFFVYTIFLSCLTIMFFGIFNSWMIWYTHLLTNLFIGSIFPIDEYSTKVYPQIINRNEFWQYSRNVLVRNFWSDLYPDDILKDISISKQNEMKNILYENKLIGTPRIRQLKVKNNSCNVHPDFADQIFECYDAFSEANEDQKSFGLKSGTPWIYSPYDSIDVYTGQINSYPNGGFYLDVPIDPNEFLEQIDVLETNNWITKGTRVIFVDFTVYNANINMFGFVKLILEFPPTGGIFPSWKIVSLKLIRYVQITDYVFCFFEIMVFLFLIYFTIEEIFELKYFERRFWSNFCNYIDIFLVVLGWLYFFLKLFEFFLFLKYFNLLIQKKRTFPNFYKLIWINQLLNSLFIIIFYVSWIKLIKYLNITKTTNRLYQTVLFTKSSVFSLLQISIIIFIVFVIIGHVLFGTYDRNFSTLLNSSISLIRRDWTSCNSSFDLFWLSKNGTLDWLTFIYFFLFILFVLIFMCLLITMFLNAYFIVGNKKNSYDDYSLILRKHFSKFYSLYQKSPPIQHIKESSTLINYEDVIDLLRRNDFSNDEIYHFVKKNHLGPSTLLNQSGIEDLIKHIDTEILLKQKCNIYSETNEKFSSLENDIDNIDCKMDEIVSRINQLQKRISQLELLNT